tara:strand:+ start:631 stop:807 length:177 start_codon:yes stop_codon:yes gene_type:complete
MSHYSTWLKFHYGTYHILFEKNLAKKNPRITLITQWLWGGGGGSVAYNLVILRAAQNK